MNKFWSVFFFLLSFFPTILFGQLDQGCEIVTESGNYFLFHIVEKGETPYSVSKKYKVPQSELSKHNPALADGMKTGHRIKIPFVPPRDKNHLAFEHPLPDRYIFVVHVADKGETLYSISRKYNLTVQEVIKYNPNAANGVRNNERLRIPKDGVVVTNIDTDHKLLNEHLVKPGETLFSISRLFGITVDEIIVYNPEAKDNLRANMVLKIPVNTNAAKENTPGPSSKHVIHQVVKGDTFFSLSKKYGVSKEQLIEWNPSLPEGLKIGNEVVIFPEASLTVSKNETAPEFRERYIVQRGETLFGIALSKGTTVSEIIEVNPGLSNRNLVVGDTLFLPVQKTKADGSREPDHDITNATTSNALHTNFSQAIKALPGDTFKVAVFMPFFFDKNEELLRGVSTGQPSDQKQEVQKEGSRNDSLNRSYDKELPARVSHALFDQSKSSFNFYEGLLLALDTLRKTGLNVALKVYDTEQKQKDIGKALGDQWLLDANLIIGPRDVRLQPTVSAFSAKNRIPMVAPFLANDSLVLHNPYFFRLTPSKREIIQQTSSYVAQHFLGQNIVALTIDNARKSSEWAMISRTKELLKEKGHASKDGHFTEMVFTGGGDQGHIQIRGVLRSEQENVIIVPLSENRREREATLMRVVNALQVLSKNFSITLIGMSDYRNLESINTELFHRLNMQYLTPSHIDYSSDHVKQFVRKYRNDFKGEPDQFSFRGYDIGYYFGKAFQAHGDQFLKQIVSVKAGHLQDRFGFKKSSALGGYGNQSLFIVNFNRDWEVKIIGEMREDKLEFFGSTTR